MNAPFPKFLQWSSHVYGIAGTALMLLVVLFAQVKNRTFFSTKIAVFKSFSNAQFHCSRAGKIWCVFISWTIWAPNIFVRCTKHCAWTFLSSNYSNEKTSGNLILNSIFNSKRNWLLSKGMTWQFKIRVFIPWRVKYWHIL